MTLLDIQNLSLRFPSNEQATLKNISYQIQQGDFVILLGSNGSGKSTLLKLLHRQYQPTTGQIYFLNKNIMQYSSTEFSKQVAVLTQNCDHALFSSLTIYENYILFQSNQKIARDKKFLQHYLQDFNPALSDKLNVLVGQLSGGEKQTLALAFYLLNPPTLLLLDEHTSALDPKTSKNIMQLTKKYITDYGITCVMTTHDLDIAMQYGNKITMLSEGRIINQFDKAEIADLTKEKLVANYY